MRSELLSGGGWLKNYHYYSLRRLYKPKRQRHEDCLNRRKSYLDNDERRQADARTNTEIETPGKASRVLCRVLNSCLPLAQTD